MSNDILNYIVLPIDGMTCSSCVANVKKSLHRINWIKTVNVNLAAEQAVIGFTGRYTDAKALKESIAEIGYSIRTRSSEIAIPGFDDPTQVANLQKLLNRIQGVEKCNFNLATQALQIEYIPGLVPVQVVEKTINFVTGVKIVWRENGAVEDEEHEKVSHRKIKLQFLNSIIATLSAVIIFIIMMPGLFEFVNIWSENIRNSVAFVLSTWALFFAGRSILKGFMAKLAPGRADMNSLVSLGAGTAWIYSTFVMAGKWINPEALSHLPLFFDSAAFIIGFILLGRFLEARVRRQTGMALKALAKLQPTNARIESEKGEEVIDISRLTAGLKCIVKNGEHVPADGILITQSAELEEAMLSGESLPVLKEKGDQVLAGTINQGSAFIFEVLKSGSETALGQIVQWVRKAQNTQPPIQHFVDKVAAVFVPIVTGLALVTFVTWIISGADLSLAIIHFINVIVIACPCALGLATPTAIIVSTGRAASAGVLVKDASVMEKMPKLNTVLFDKTGTLTSGKLLFKEMLSFGTEDSVVLSIAAGLEQHSTHPIAKAVLAETKDRKVEIAQIGKAEMLTGFGIKSILDGVAVGAGNKELMQAMGVLIPDILDKKIAALTEQGASIIFVAKAKALIGLISFTDSIREEAVSLITKLNKLHIKSAMVTGDAQGTAEAIAAKLSILEIYAEQPPQVKGKVVKKMQENGEIVAMIGDGINDAVALTQADIGISFSDGTEIAMEAADLVFLRTDLNLLLTTKNLSVKTERIIKQNLIWAFGYNVLMLPSAAGLLYLLFDISFNPAFAALAMAMSSVSVVLNSLRLKVVKI